MLKAALSGGYVNFGVLRLYGDDALDSAIRIFVKLLESVEQRDLMVWTFFKSEYRTDIFLACSHYFSRWRSCRIFKWASLDVSFRL